MTKNFAIKGHPTRGKEVIEILKMLGGINKWHYWGSDEVVYFIEENDKYITYCGKECIKNTGEYIIYELEEFLEKYPFKVGDFVFAGNWSYAVDIRQMHWNAKTQEVEYMVKPCATELWYTANKLTKYAMPKFNVGETVYNKHTHEFGEIIKYQWQKTEYIYLISHLSEDAWYLERQLTNDVKSVDNENKMKNVLAELLEHIKTTSKEDLEKEFEELKEWSNVGPTVEEFMDFCNKVNKKLEYPKTYDECCKNVLGLVHWGMTVDVPMHYSPLIIDFAKLLICRDAYWKLAGKEMGLDKSWESPLPSLFETVYCIRRKNNEIIKGSYRGGKSEILEFPTEEMRDTFYENFKDFIEECKELL